MIWVLKNMILHNRSPRDISISMKALNLKHMHLEGRLALVQYAFMNRDTQINFFGTNREVSSFESDRQEFLGDNEYGTWQAPLSLEQAELGNHEANRGENIGALLIHLGELAPGATVSFVTVLGQAANPAEAGRILARWQSEAAVTTAFTHLQAVWQERLAALQVKTPDADLDRMVLDRFPLVLVDRYLKGISACSLYVDNQQAARDLTEYLIGLGHSQIAFVSPPVQGTSTIEERMQGVAAGLAAHVL